MVRIFSDYVCFSDASFATFANLIISYKKNIDAAFSF